MVVAALIGLGLPGLADRLSVQRDTQLQQSINRLNTLVEGLLQPPQSWTMQVGAVTYVCTRQPEATAASPAYACTSQRGTP